MWVFVAFRKFSCTRYWFLLVLYTRTTEYTVEPDSAHMLDDHAIESLERQVPLLITPTLYAGISIVLSLMLTVISHHYTEFQYATLASIIAATLIEIGFFTKRAVLYIPMLLIWLFWLTLRITNTSYLECVEYSNCKPIVFPERTYQLINGVHFLASLLTFLRPFRHPVVLFVIAVSVSLSHTVPSPEIPEEWTTVVRVACFVILYYLSLVVTACYSVVEKRSNTGVVKVLQSQWCLFINNPYMLILASVVQGMVAAAFIFLNVHNLEHARYAEDGITAHTDHVDEGSKKDSSIDEM